MRLTLTILAVCASAQAAIVSGPYSPAAGQPGSTAISYYTENGQDYHDSRILGWASDVVSVNRGLKSVANPGLGLVNWGSPLDALGPANAYDLVDDAEDPQSPTSVMSLGDRGSITLTFPVPIGNGPGPDLAVFENAHSNEFLELAIVEVSSNGTDFYKFPSISLTQTGAQVGAFGSLDTTNIHNLAGKFRAGFGTPFDLAELAGIPELDISMITHVRITDVVGSLNSSFGTYDSLGNLINDPWETKYDTGGFDLDAVAYLNIPEPATLPLLFFSVAALCRRRVRR